MNHIQLQGILSKAAGGISLTYREILQLLSLEDPREIQEVMSAARRVRDTFFGNRVFLYGFIYFSTYCRNHCAFCYYRKTNELSPRYRKGLEDVLEIAVGLADSGAHLVDLTMGEDPLMHDSGDFEMLFEMISEVKKKTGLPVMVSPGVVPDEILRRFRAGNMDWYALYQETHNPSLYKNLRIGQSFEERVAKRAAARRAGILIEDGILLGVGETISDRAYAVMAMKREGVHQARVMSLVPQRQTPLAGRVEPTRISEYLCIAVMRLAMPDRLIPASLDVDGIKGLRMRLEAGANVVTSIIPPSSNLAGVSQSTLDIEQGLRTVPAVKKILNGMGLQAADAADYAEWVADRKERIGEEVSYDDHWHRRGKASGIGSCLSGSSGRT